MNPTARLIVRYGYLAALSALPIALAVRLEYWIAHGYWPNLKQPRKFNEWLAWRKINWSDERYIVLSDKITMKDYVCSSLGAEWVIPTLWVGSDSRMMPTIEYPYILKPNNSSGKSIIVRRDAEAECAFQESQKWARQWNRSGVTERWYRRITYKLLVEPFLSEDGSPPVDYKYFCFEGEVVCVQVDLNRWHEHRQAFFNKKWERLSIKYQRYACVHQEVPCPPYFEETVEAVEKLSAGFDFVRVDVYAGTFGMKVGELTFCPQSGLLPFERPDMDLWLGSQWPSASLGES